MVQWTDIITPAVAGASVAGVFAWVNGFWQRKFDLRKWRAELYLRPKVESLRRLHEALVKSHFEINERVRANPPRDLAEFTEFVKPQVNQFFDSLMLAEIYLEAPDRELMLNVLGSLRQMSRAIWVNLPESRAAYPGPKDSGDEPDWRLFRESYECAHACLGRLLHPDKLMRSLD